MLTIFGKKKKDDSSVQIDTGTVPSQPPSQTPSMQPQAPIPTNTQDQPPTWPTPGPLMGQTTPPPPAPSIRQMSREPAQGPRLDSCRSTRHSPRKKRLYRKSYKPYSKTSQRLQGPPSVQYGRRIPNKSHLV